MKSPLAAPFGRPPALRLRLDLDQAEGRVQQVELKGISLRNEIRLLPAIRSLAPIRLHVEQVAGPVPVRDLAATITLAPSPRPPLPLVTLAGCSLSLLGGRVAADPLTIDPGRPVGRLTLHLAGIDLAEILALHKVKGLQVSGRVNGTLPIEFKGKTVRISQGRLTNTAGGGVVRYVPPDRDSLAGSPLTGYALRALSDFHYHLLRAGVNYRPDGLLGVDFHLEGKSPALDTPRPVHLNISTEQNLLSLLKSLSYSGTISDEIGKRVEKFYQPQNP